MLYKILKWSEIMCAILLSINPNHVENILNGSKKYEFRKRHVKDM